MGVSVRGRERVRVRGKHLVNIYGRNTVSKWHLSFRVVRLRPTLHFRAKLWAVCTLSELGSRTVTVCVKVRVRAMYTIRERVAITHCCTIGG